MRAPFQWDASSFKVSAGPSIQRLSLFTTRNGSAAAGFQQLLALVGNRDGQALGPGREVSRDRAGQIVDIDHDILDARGAQAFQNMVDERLARDLDERLRLGRGQRAHPLAEARRHDHRGLRYLCRNLGPKP